MCRKRELVRAASHCRMAQLHWIVLPPADFANGVGSRRFIEDEEAATGAGIALLGHGWAALTFDMSGDRQTAKLAVGRPLDGRVRHLCAVHLLPTLQR